MRVTMPLISCLSPQVLKLQAMHARADLHSQHVFWQIDEISQSWPGVLETVPGLNTLIIHFASPRDLEYANDQLPLVWKTCLKRAINRAVSVVTLGVCYGGRSAPYLTYVAKQAGLTVDKWIDLHVSTAYTVVNVGTHPGMACLGELLPQLQVFKGMNFRQPVSAGGVAVNEFRTAIAASSLPLGWNLVGVISHIQFDNHTEGFPSLQPGDRVCFGREPG